MMDEFIGTYGNNLIVAVVGVGVALLALAIILWIIRRRGGSSPFIRGGKNRQPRLQVLDATAVDARRRLVLVRRDNVEHLVMIGGPTDIVIESGIGAIPILRDVRDPQDEMPSIPSEKPRAIERTRTLPPVKEDETRIPATMASSAPAAPQPEAKPRPVAAPAVAAAPPKPVTPPAPKQSAPAAPPVVTSAPAVAAPTPSPAPAAVTPPPPPTPRPAPPVVAQPAPEVSPAPRAIAREPVTPPVIPAIVPAVTAASLQAEPVAARPNPPAPPVEDVAPPQPVAFAPTVAPEPVAVREPVIDQNNAGDFLDAARERVLPTFRTTTPMSATATAAKSEPLAPTENGPVFGDQLTSDFESFLEAEIARNNAGEAPDISLEPAAAPQDLSDPAPLVANEPSDRDVQKEMARIFGEMAVTRDK